MKNINTNAPVHSRQSILINSNQEKVWSALTNIDQWARWQTDISKPRLYGELKANTTFDWKNGGVNIHSILHTVEPYQYFGWTGKSLGIKAIHNWTISRNNGKVMVEVDESLEGLLAVVFKKSLKKSLEKGLLNWLDLLKKECEK